MGLYFSLKFFYFHAAPVGVSPEVSARGYVGAGLYLLLLCCSVLKMKECSDFVLVFKKLKSIIFTFRSRNL